VSQSLENRVAVVTGADLALGRGLAMALGGAGASIGLLGDARALAGVVADLEALEVRATAVALDASARETVEDAFGVIADELGAIDIVVHAATPPQAFEAMDIVDVDDERWEAVWEVSMRTTLFTLQAGFGQMQGRGGRIIVVIPTIAMSGAEQLAPYVTAAEGQRLLVKAAARQWGTDSITVNCLAVAPEQLPIEVATTAVALAAPALGGPGDVESDLGPIAVFLAGDAGHYLTGATLCADGGIWMAP
jgi:NAD(P)-dependent dehydrogenase (short-subunit alcohol dehydrogenase family)